MVANMAVIGWMLLVVTIMGWHRASLVGAYNVAEHRLDYIKLGEGREYNYHYNDGISSGFDKRKFYKRPPVFNKQPYSLKNFPSPVEQIITNEFQSHPETQTYVRQESLLPVYESHEKSVQYVPLDFHSSKSTPTAAGLQQQQQQQYSSAPSSSFGHQNHQGPSFTTNLAERVIQMIQLQHPPSSAKNGTAGSSVTSTSSVHFQAPGQTQQYTHSGQHPGSYQYFNAHPAPASYELVRPISNFPPPRPYLAPALTTTKAPYLAPILLKSTSTTPATATVTVAPTRRPRPYVAPTVRPNAGSGSVTNDPLLSSVSLANQLKYTSSRPSTSSRPPSTGGNRNQQQQQQQQQQQLQKQPYEPEFDIDIRIDLRDDSA